MKNLKARLGAAALTIAVGVGLAACNNGPNAQQYAQNQQQAAANRIEHAQPIPEYNYSQERQTLIEAQNMAAKGTPSVTFFFNYGDPDPYLVCNSIGIGIPDTASLSNPDQIAPVSGKYGGGTQVVGQMDAYGIYTPSSSTGTFVICVNSQGAEYLVRDEGITTTLGAGAYFNYTKHQIVVGNPTTHINTDRKPNG